MVVRVVGAFRLFAKVGRLGQVISRRTSGRRLMHDHCDMLRSAMVAAITYKAITYDT